MTETKIIRKQLVIIGIIALLVHVGLSGCVESNLIVKINGPTYGTVNENFIYNVSVQGGTKPFVYEWDLNNDGEYTESINETVVFTPTYGGNHIIKVRVTDKNGKHGDANTTLSLPLTEPKMVLKSVTYSPRNPVEKENINFTLILENTGDDRTPVMALGLNWTHRDGNRSSNWRNNLFSLEGHSQNNITLSTGVNKTDDGMQSFKIVYNDFQGADEITIKQVDINIEPLPPEIYLCITTENVIASGEYPEKKTFNAGETVCAYIEYANVNHNSIVDVNLSIVVHHQESWIIYYSKNKDDKQISKSDILWYALWNFPTYDTSNGNWPSGKYQVDIEIRDKITEKTNTTTIYFTIL
jgi:hypothetical protein